ncbi:MULTISPECIES: DUF2274 domain-containing protein [Novosphingobium]|uniref:DUF2274 domain-containing protein n=1 Tax=Novosphingobium TaxID=165696 RepID=UPI00057E4E87|nr:MULTISPECIES: DUF2274 domain-containing protein [Novosphingobium]TYC93068.1 DUF2274 domain-containing protein [Novosphingobium sp. BW1]GAM07402.1 hypothetical conserved protein [Novosphingobium sp. MBES04]
MSAIRLAKLPETTPVKIVIRILPDLHRDLEDYAKAYAQAYGKPIELAELIPAMLAGYLDADRAFRQGQKSK